MVRWLISFFKKYFSLLTHLFFAVLGHCCSADSSLVAESRGSSLAVGGLLNAVASLVAEQGSRAHGLQQLRHTGLVSSCSCQTPEHRLNSCDTGT